MYQYQVVVGREGPRLVLTGLFAEVVARVDYVARSTFLRQWRRRRQELLVEEVTEDRLVVTRRRRRVEDG